MSDALRWLWITAELPGDRSTGRLVYSGSLVDAIAEAGHTVTVVGHGRDIDTSVGGVAVHPVDEPMRGGPRSLLSTLPNLAYACSASVMRDAVARLLDEPWDVIVIDHLQAAWAVAPVRAQAGHATVVFVTHNHEASVRRAVASELPLWSPRRAVLSFDAWKAARLERRAVAEADVITAITRADADRFAADADGVDAVVVTPGWSGTPVAIPTPLADRSRAVAVLGSFDWHVKQENLRRFVAAADGVLADAGVELRVAGSVPDDFRAEITDGSRSVRFMGFVDDAGAFLDDCRLGLIDEPLGGGFKLKSLDYVFHHLPIAATAGSAVGLPLEAGVSLLEAADSAALARQIVDRIDDTDTLRRLAEAAVERCERQFSWARQAAHLVERVTTLRALGGRTPDG